MIANKLENLKRLNIVLEKVYNEVKNREGLLNVNIFTVENTVKVDDCDISTLFHFYKHGYTGVRDAIQKLNNLHNSNTGDGFALIFSQSHGCFYLLFKNRDCFIDAFNTIYEECKSLYKSENFYLN